MFGFPFLLYVAVCYCQTLEKPSVVTLDVVYRDMFFEERACNDAPDFPDFWDCLSGGQLGGSEKGIVQSMLGSDGTPVYAKGDGSGSKTTSGADNFYNWYHHVPGINAEYVRTLNLTLNQGTGLYEFIEPSFFPLNDVGLADRIVTFKGNQCYHHPSQQNPVYCDDGSLCQNKASWDPYKDGGWLEQCFADQNFLFTTVISTAFVVQPGQVFNFNGDDDVFVFINNTLVIDLGGVHGPEFDSVDIMARFPLAQEGDLLRIDFFHAERHCCGSSFALSANLCFDRCPGSVCRPLADSCESRRSVQHPCRRYDCPFRVGEAKRSTSSDFSPDDVDDHLLYKRGFQPHQIAKRGTLADDPDDPNLADGNCIFYHLSWGECDADGDSCTVDECTVEGTCVPTGEDSCTICGDGTVDHDEDCEVGQTQPCSTIVAPGEVGTVTCDEDTCAWDTSDCRATASPTASPTLVPTSQPTVAPTPNPTQAPTPLPTPAPTSPAPTAHPTSSPTSISTPAPPGTGNGADEPGSGEGGDGGAGEGGDGDGAAGGNGDGGAGEGEAGDGEGGDGEGGSGGLSGDGEGEGRGEGEDGGNDAGGRTSTVSSVSDGKSEEEGSDLLIPILAGVGALLLVVAVTALVLKRRSAAAGGAANIDTFGELDYVEPAN